MTIDLEKFSALQKNSSRSFHQQKKVIKKLMAGQQVLCEHCQHPLKLHLPREKQPNDQSTHVKSTDDKSTICCAKGCTDIQLDFY